MRGGKRAFTLTELLVVMAVIIILLSILVVSVDVFYAWAMQLRCQHHMEEIWKACEMYASKNHSWLPAAWNYNQNTVWYKTLVQGEYLDNEAAVQCPLSDIQVSATTGGQITYMPEQNRTALDKALQWFKTNQKTDGSWQSARSPAQDRGTTALGLLTYLGFGCTENTGPEEYRDTVKKGFDYLIANQAADGSFTTEYIDYTQGICTMALCDGLAMGMERLRPYAQKAFDYLVGRQAVEISGGFSEAGCSRDMSATGWGYQGLASAKHAGLTPSGNYSSSAAGGYANQPKTWATIDARANEMFKRCIQINVSGKSDEYHTVYVFNESGYDHGEQTAYRMSSVNLALRLLWGHIPASGFASPKTYSNNENCYGMVQYITGTPQGQPSAAHLYYAGGQGVPEVTGEGPSTYDLYTIYYLSLAMWSMGGLNWDAYKAAMVPKLIALQNANGSFPTNFAPYCNSWGGLPTTTALGAMCFEASVAEYLQGTKWTKAGEYPYGYNPGIGEKSSSPSPDTIVLIDYMRSAIDMNDPQKYMAPRHRGKVNALFADGHVEQLVPENITAGQLSTKAGD